MPKNPDWIPWRNCVPRAIIIEDLIAGYLPMDNDEMTAEHAWKYMYENMDEFKEAKVVFSQFAARLKDHRTQVKKNLKRAARETQALRHDRKLIPRKATNHKGEKVFDLSEAKLLLRDDIENDRHCGITPTQLWLSRPEYQEFELDIFRHRIYQEQRRKKFVFYLNYKRNEGHLLRCKPPKSNPYDNEEENFGNGSFDEDYWFNEDDDEDYEFKDEMDIDLLYD